MVNKEFDIRLNEEQEKERIKFLMARNFDDFKIHWYYYKSFLKHGVTLDEVREIYPKFDKIVGVYKREGNKGYLYSFIYDLGDFLSLYLIFILDENPPQFFNAYYDHTKSHKAIKNRIKKWIVSGNVKG